MKPDQKTLLTKEYWVLHALAAVLLIASAKQSEGIYAPPLSEAVLWALFGPLLLTAFAVLVIGGVTGILYKEWSQERAMSCPVTVCAGGVLSVMFAINAINGNHWPDQRAAKVVETIETMEARLSEQGEEVSLENVKDGIRRLWHLDRYSDLDFSDRGFY